MKKISIVIVLLSLLLSGVVLADEGAISELPGSGWWSGESIQNIGTGEASLVGVAYDMDATATYETDPFTIPLGGSITIMPASLAATGDPVFTGMDGKRGSAIFSSDEPLVATVNVTNRDVAGLVGISGGYAAGIYEGTSGQETGTQLNFPIAKNNFVNKDTTYFIQNAGGEAAVIYAMFVWDGGSYRWSSTTAIEPGYGIAIPAENMPDNTLGSAVVTSTVALAGVHTEHESNESGTSPSQVFKATKAFVPADGDDVIIAPSYKKGFGAGGSERSSSLNIQAQEDDVSGTVTYTCAAVNFGATDACTLGEEYTVDFGPIDEGESYVAFPYLPDHSGLPDFSLYSAQVVATGNIVATVDETGFNAGGATTSPNRDSTYSAIPEKAAASKWSCPVVKERFFGNGGAPTVFATGSDVTVDVIYGVANSENDSYVGNEYTINDFAITGGTSATFFDVAYGGTSGISWDGDSLPGDTGLNAGVTIESSGPIVVTTNENVHYLSSLLQDAKQYSCFPLE